MKEFNRKFRVDCCCHGNNEYISRNFSMGPLFSKYDWMGAYDSGL